MELASILIHVLMFIAFIALFLAYLRKRNQTAQILQWVLPAFVGEHSIAKKRRAIRAILELISSSENISIAQMPELDHEALCQILGLLFVSDVESSQFKVDGKSSSTAEIRELIKRGRWQLLRYSNGWEFRRQS